MIVQMQVGIDENHPLTQDVIKTARNLGLKTQTHTVTGVAAMVTEVYLLDDAVAAGTLPEHVFRQLPGVNNVRRVTPSAVSLAANGTSHPHRILLGAVDVSNALPCRLIAGPCTVDSHIDELVDGLVHRHGIKMIRGGCWKPRSDARSFPGLGKLGVRWFLTAAAKHGVAVVFTEVMDETHIHDIEEIQQQTGYTGKIVLWVGARTENQVLLRRLGRQSKFPIMLKNPIAGRSVKDWIKRAEFVIAGDLHFDHAGRLIKEESLRQGNDQILLCARGVEDDDEESLYRFAPRHEWITTLRQRYWPPVGVDPSHSAGTMADNLVLRNLESALVHQPAFVLLETYFDDRQALCDAKQAVPLSRLPEVQAMIAAHNQRHYGCGPNIW